MAVTTPIIIIGIIIIAIWLIIEFKRFRHKLLAIFLIILVLSIYISFTLVSKGKNIDLKTLPGIKNAITLYFAWIGTVFGNFKSITSSAIKMDWGAENKTKG